MRKHIFQCFVWIIMETLLNWISINSILVYFLLFAYCFLKSGALPLFAGVLVGLETLLLAPVTLSCFLGAYLGDELRYYLGRNYSTAIQNRWPKTRRYIEAGIRLMDKYGSWYVFLYRYPKGMRTIGAFPVGMSSMKYKRFFLLNTLSATLWVFILVGSGAMLGRYAENFAQDYYGMISIGLFLCFAISIWYLFNRYFKANS